MCGVGSRTASGRPSVARLEARDLGLRLEPRVSQPSLGLAEPRVSRYPEPGPRQLAKLHRSAQTLHFIGVKEVGLST